LGLRRSTLVIGDTELENSPKGPMAVRLFAQSKADLNATSRAAYIPDSRMRALGGSMTTGTQKCGHAFFLWTGVAVGLTIVLDGAGFADEASQVKAGQELAEKICSPCHAVSEKVGSPFPDIAKGDHATPTALRDFLRTTHANVSHPGAMPNPELTEQEIDELAAYIGSLRPSK
jgi:mono/diheme cytochrome c family protein